MSYADAKVNLGFFNNQGDISLKQMILSGKVSNASEILFMSTLSANFRQIRSKLKELS